LKKIRKKFPECVSTQTEKVDSFIFTNCLLLKLLAEAAKKKFKMKFLSAARQGDQIGRIFAHWTIVYFGQFGRFFHTL
jgi:hypothetical protein